MSDPFGIVGHGWAVGARMPLGVAVRESRARTPVMGVARDTDTAYYYTPTGGGPVQLDTDGVVFFTGANGGGVEFDTDATPYFTI